jgi:hypothetical protein
VRAGLARLKGMVGVHLGAVGGGRRQAVSGPDPLPFSPSAFSAGPEEVLGLIS